MAETLSTLSIISFAVAGVFLVLAVFLWFFLKIPSVIGDLSGKTARKSIAKMRAVNEKSGAGGNGMQRKTAGSAPRQVPHVQTSGQARPAQTPRPAASRASETVLLKETLDAEETTSLAGTELLADDEGTELLTDDEGTVLLRPEEEAGARKPGGVKLTMKEEVMLIHTNEVIE